MKTTLVIFGVILFLGVLEGGNQFLTIKSDLTAQQKEAREEWANVGQALQRRAALISDLANRAGLGDTTMVATQDVSQARKVLEGLASPQEKLAANQQLSTVLSRLMTDANNNRGLQADKSFAQWKDELEKCDNQVAVERNHYNKLLERYNARLQQFPESLVASMAGFHRDDAYFRTDNALSSVPKK